jgi:hypothetical protein
MSWTDSDAISPVNRVTVNRYLLTWAEDGRLWACLPFIVHHYGPAVALAFVALWTDFALSPSDSGVARRVRAGDIHPRVTAAARAHFGVPAEIPPVGTPEYQELNNRIVAAVLAGAELPAPAPLVDPDMGLEAAPPAAEPDSARPVEAASDADPAPLTPAEAQTAQDRWENLLRNGLVRR